MKNRIFYKRIHCRKFIPQLWRPAYCFSFQENKAYCFFIIFWSKQYLYIPILKNIWKIHFFLAKVLQLLDFILNTIFRNCSSFDSCFNILLVEVTTNTGQAYSTEQMIHISLIYIITYVEKILGNKNPCSQGIFLWY